MHLYRYFKIAGNIAFYLDNLCLDNIDFDSNSHWYCRDFLRCSVGSIPICELKVDHGWDEIKSGSVDFVRFAIMFKYIRRTKYQVEAISRSILVDVDKIEEVDVFIDVDDFLMYHNFYPNIYTEEESEEEEECIR